MREDKNNDEKIFKVNLLKREIFGNIKTKLRGLMTAIGSGQNVYVQQSQVKVKFKIDFNTSFPLTLDLNQQIHPSFSRKASTE